MSPRFISDEGVQIPAMERVVLKNTSEEVITNPSAEGTKYAGEKVQPGEDYIYIGPDRGAMQMLEDQGLMEQGYMGNHFTENIDIFELARSKGYDSVEDYVEKMGYKSDKAKELVAKHKEQYHTHKTPEKKKGAKFTGGGTNTTGGEGGIDGGFGERPKLG